AQNRVGGRPDAYRGLHDLNTLAGEFVGKFSEWLGSQFAVGFPRQRPGGQRLHDVKQRYPRVEGRGQTADRHDHGCLGSGMEISG
ncbi:MAG TPA: hypothetical protein VKE94_08670, partial [Gemmataceae bacterium]|nr:hypothetical protein [Gemmataceae bacterium]